MRLKHAFILILVIIGIFFAGFITAAAVPGRVIKTFKTPGNNPTGMTFDNTGNKIWLADTDSCLIYSIDPDSGEVLRKLESPGFEPLGLAWDGSLLWCVDGEECYIYGLNIAKGTAEKIIESYSKKPGGLAYANEFLWLLDNNDQKILKINREDGMMHENIPSPAPICYGLAFDGTYLWTCDPAEDAIYRVEPNSGDVVTVLDSNGPLPHGLCWDGKTLWNADAQKNELYCLDLKGDTWMNKKNPQVYSWEVVQEFRNYGPGEAQNLDVYIAVPNAQENQEIQGEIRYQPQPKDFVTDQWDQKFAHFHFDNTASGSILKSKLLITTRQYDIHAVIFPERVGPLSQIPEECKKFLVDGVKFDIKNDIIKNAVKEAVGDEKRPYWMMRKIFNYIMAHLEYNLKPLGGWNPAPTVLKRGTGSCSEYTFVFIAMCRAAGLPARYSGALVVRSQDKGIDNVWHRWAQVYLPNYGWVPVDVQAGDKRAPGRRAQCIGGLSNRYLITTNGGGDSQYLDFYYNFNSKWKTKGKCHIVNKQYGQFSPHEKTQEPGNKQ